MPLYKAIIDFSNYDGPGLLPVAQNIRANLNTHNSNFPDLPVAPAALATLIATFEAALSSRLSRATADVLHYNEARHALETALHDDGVEVNSVAKGDLDIILLGGYPYYNASGNAPLPDPPPAPTNPTVRHGAVEGSVIFRFKPIRPDSTGEVQLTYGDPNDAAGWKFADVSKSGMVKLGGLTVGATAWLRARTKGRTQMGAWSDPIKIVVT